MEKSRNTKVKIIDIITILPVKSVIAAVTLYKILISPLLGSRCRFYPSCSEYLIQAVEKKGLVKGMAIGIYRIGRCNPFNPGGYDPVK